MEKSPNGNKPHAYTTIKNEHDDEEETLNIFRQRTTQNIMEDLESAVTYNSFKMQQEDLHHSNNEHHTLILDETQRQGMELMDEAGLRWDSSDISYLLKEINQGDLTKEQNAVVKEPSTNQHLHLASLKSPQVEKSNLVTFQI